MANLTQLRIAARAIFGEALLAVDAGDAVRHAVRLEGSSLKIVDAAMNLTPDRPVYAIAIGKAANSMASALPEILGERLTAGVISSIAPVGSTRVHDSRFQVFHGGHPEPNEQSLLAAQACFELLARADEERALIIFLISGGGSAMIEMPISEDITLADLRAANWALVSCGASITEINAVRRTLSAVKGGRLAARAPRCDQITLIVSDVPPGAEANVASGPTLAPPIDASAAREVVARFKLRSRLPASVLHAIETQTSGETSAASHAALLRERFVLLDNHHALDAAAKAAESQGLAAEIASDISDQSVESGCAELLTRLGSLCERLSRDKQDDDESNLVCLISGGEFACPARGGGMGGRNLETALRLAIEYHAQHLNKGQPDKHAHFVALCAGTDGIDGNSPVAGAIVDDTTIERANAIGLDARSFLERSDAYSFFVALGDAIATGPTGTNVRDIRILLNSR